MTDVNRFRMNKDDPSILLRPFLSSFVFKVCIEVKGMMHVSCMCPSQRIVRRADNNQMFLLVATPALEREHPNLFCVYARVGEEKETQTQVFWELICRS